MNENTKDYGVSEYLFDLTEKQVVTLDHEATNGEGWILYCQSFINRPTVFKNKITGRFRNIERDNFVEVKVDERQITTFCSSCRNGEICLHSVALLYSWIYDGDAFLNIENSIKQLKEMKKGELIDIITRILLNDSDNIEYVMDRPEDDDDYDLDGLLN
ncbi:hypothetical protein GWO43_05480 [candidate division KSB1 bacterium]|nr:hypothetical protein [candidate division KSB1 bacterium]NIR71601.1 hypothetical protein [candidate division KSB1 bacterium]NIS23436.1 hypothetical protein [candidate division KSB1 bacterium]NIT70344.1 hypothetical protein [candidate division KSB1 bacterium]NIU24046.1 hypothetical protein [candidate division KSB1 bacterium]